jgi:hypothetical protein
MQMQAMGLQLLIDDTKGQSATGEIRDDAKENSPLAMMATQLQDALDAGGAEHGALCRQARAEGGDLMISKDFGITATGSTCNSSRSFASAAS